MLAKAGEVWLDLASWWIEAGSGKPIVPSVWELFLNINSTSHLRHAVLRHMDPSDDSSTVCLEANISCELTLKRSEEKIECV